MQCLNSFFSLELITGVRVAATFSVILSCPMLSVGCIYLKSLDFLRESYDYRYRSYNNNFNYLMGVSYTASAVFFSISAFLLALSAHKRNHRYSWPWLLVTGFSILYYAILLIWYGFSDHKINTGERVIMSLVIIVMVYFVVVVYSFVQQIKTQPFGAHNQLVVSFPQKQYFYHQQVSTIDGNCPKNGLMQHQLYPSLPMNDGRDFSPPQQLYQSKPQQTLQDSQQTTNSFPPIQLPPLQPNTNSQAYEYPPSLYSSQNPQLVTTNPSYALNSAAIPTTNYLPQSQPPNNSLNISTNQYSTFPNPTAPNPTGFVYDIQPINT